MQNLFVLLVNRFEERNHLFKDAGLLHIEPHVAVLLQGKVDVDVYLVGFLGDEEHFVILQENADLLQQERAHLADLQLLSACFLLAQNGVLTISDQIDDVAVALYHFEVELGVGENTLIILVDLSLRVIRILQVFELLDCNHQPHGDISDLKHDVRALTFELLEIVEALGNFFELDHFALSQVEQILDLVFQFRKLLQELQVSLELLHNAFGVFEDSPAVDHLLNGLLHVDDFALREFVRSPVLLDESHESSEFGGES